MLFYFSAPRGTYLPTSVVQISISEWRVVLAVYEILTLTFDSTLQVASLRPAKSKEGYFARLAGENDTKNCALLRRGSTGTMLHYHRRGLGDTFPPLSLLACVCNPNGV